MVAIECDGVKGIDELSVHMCNGGRPTILTLKALVPACCCLDAGFWWSVAIVTWAEFDRL